MQYFFKEKQDREKTKGKCPIFRESYILECSQHDCKFAKTTAIYLMVWIIRSLHGLTGKAVIAGEEFLFCTTL